VLDEIPARDRSQSLRVGDPSLGRIALLLHYVINPARRLTTNNRLIETSGKTVRAWPGWK
jgi:hypothetical protein